MQLASTSAAPVSPENCKLFGKPLALKDDSWREAGDDMLGVGVVLPGPGVTHRVPLYTRTP